MHIILLSGGSGRRLWPISNDIRSKQFIKIFKKADGSYESMLQRMYRQIREVLPEAEVTIASSRAQVSAICNQLDESVNISVEPCRKDTFPAIVLAVAYLVDVKQIDLQEPIVVCPVDPYVEKEYFRALKKLYIHAGMSSTNLTLLGIRPTYPAEKYGYILPENASENPSSFFVREFKEKPDKEMARYYIEQGALWNSGVFAFKPEYILTIARKLLGYKSYEDLYERYGSLQKISFDYAVVEKEKKIQVIEYIGIWKDLGTWNTLTEAMEDPIVGKAVLNGTCEGVQIINELGIPILAMGLRNVVISASPEGILVSDKEQSSYIKPYVDRLDHQVMYAEKSWGSYRVLDVEDGSMTVKVTLNAGHGMNYHSHRERDEIWVVVDGEGQVVIDGIWRNIRKGDVVMMKAGQKHSVIAETELRIVEVQIGKEINVEDKEKYLMPDMVKIE